MPSQPVAVIGMSCRLPGGVDSPESFWHLLSGGGEGLGQLPPDRWESYPAGHPGWDALRRVPTAGGFLAGIYGFDAAFFGVSRREAELMDPQQRLTLEVAWEALEHAGIPPHVLAGTDTGVFMGVNADDYGRRLLEDLPRIEAWTGIGSSLCAVANRVSYHLDLRGPSMAVDTACSSSLVALHLACRSLQAGETPLALAGGVMLMAAPSLTMVMHACGALAPDGRSKPFDASADGYGRGEGCGVLVLKRLSDAERDGDRVLAVVRGGAVSQDGRTDGIMAPSQRAQEHLLRRAYAAAGVPPESVDYVEAHGTGTRAGDPVEAGALAAVLGAGRGRGEACLVGSVKSNIGHLEAASGVAGVIKTVLALWHGRIPASLHIVEPNPAVRWDEGGLRLAARPTGWPRRDRPRRAGVSGYGYGGTIAHLVLEEAPAAGATGAGNPEGRSGADPRAAEPSAADPTRSYPLSAASLDGLHALAARLGGRLAAGGTGGPDDKPNGNFGGNPNGDLGGNLGGNPNGNLGGNLGGNPGGNHRTGRTAAGGPDLDDVGHTLALRRTHLRYRAAIVAADRAELVAGLDRLARGDPGHRVVTGQVCQAATGPGPVWVFSGHGSQWVGMGRGLLGTEPAFDRVLACLDPVFTEELGLSPRQALLTDPLSDVCHVQPMIFAVQLALAEVWRSYGLAPAAVIGHSVGEVTAAVVAGMFGAAEGARLVCRRSALLRRVAGRGAMALVGLPWAEVTAQLAGRTDVTAAISSSPQSTVVSGAAGAVAGMARRWREAGLLVQPIQSDVAFHSAQMNPLLADLGACLGWLRPARPQVRTYATATEDPRSDPPRDAGYWACNLRQPVRFAAAVAAALADGHRVFLEVSPHPVVLQSVLEVFAETGVEDGVVAYSLRRNRPDRAELLTNLGALHCAGLPVDWARVHRGGRLTDLPGTAWQHREYRAGAPAGTAPPGDPVRWHDPTGHTLLGADRTVHGPSPARVWETTLDRGSRPYPGDHPVRGVEIVPACVLLNTFFTAARGDADAPFPVLADVALRVPVAVTGTHRLQVVHSGGALRLSSRSTRGEAEGWLTHTAAMVAPVTAEEYIAVARGSDTEQEPPGVPIDPGFVVERLAEIGVAGIGFPWRIEELSSTPGALTATVTADDSGAAPQTWASILDAALSIASVVFPGPPRLRMPAHVERVAVLGAPPLRVLVEARARAGDGAASTVDVDVRSGSGPLVARFAGLSYRELDGDLSAPVEPARLVHEMVWRPVPPPHPAGELRQVVLVGTGAGLAAAVTARLTADGLRCRSVGSLADLTDPSRGRPDDLDGSSAVLVMPPGSGGRAVADRAHAGAWQLVRTAQVLAGWPPAGPGRGRPRLWCLTRGVRESAGAAAVADSPLWGLARVVAGEHPDLWGGTVDLDGDDPARDLDLLTSVLRGRPDEDVLALRGGAVLTARLSRVDRRGARRLPYCRPHGTYLVTGGLGALGLEVASWLAAQGARRIVLAGRRPLPPRSRWDGISDPTLRRRVDAVRALEAAGVTVRTVGLDVADQASATRQLAAATADLPPVLGVVHAAGVLDNRLVRDVDAASLRAVLRPKVAGALVLHELYPPGTLDFFVLFSSAGLLLGLPGQASYAAANGFLDALARHRRGLGDRGAVSFGWSSWRGLGMSTSSAAIDAELAARGAADITAADAFRCWEYAAGAEPAYLAVLRTVPPAYGTALPALLRDLPAASAGDPAGPGGAEVPEEAAGAPWTGLTGDRMREALLAEVSRLAQDELKLGPGELDVRRPLAELGLDSLLTQAVRRRLERQVRLALPATLLWEHRTVAALADYLAERLAGEPEPGGHEQNLMPAR
jgi:6-methylsalicylic acid synthase